jgi:hypothetical protein
MGTRRGPYKEDFPTGTLVRINALPELERFRAEWKLHHPLQELQLAFAGRTACVKDLGFYHGGDELYWLDGVPGIWHECCLEAAGEAPQQRT